MRFPLALTAKIAAYIIGKKLKGEKKFATVLQLEPLFTVHLLRLRADECFVHLDRRTVTSHLSPRTTLKREANTMQHKPSCFLRYAKKASQLV